MPVFEQTYQPWTGKYEARPMRSLALFQAAFRLTWKSLLVKIFLIFVFVIVFFWMGFLLLAATAQVPPIFALGNRIYHERFFNEPMFQQLIMVVTAVAGAGLVSFDRKHNAFAMYFSKAITRWDYIFAKYLVVIAFIGLGTFVPGLLLWIGQVTIGQEEYTFMQHYSDLSAIFAQSMVIALPAGAVMLAFSSMSKTRYIPAILWILLYEGTALISAILTEVVDLEWPALLSYRNLTSHLGMMFYEWRPVQILSPFARNVPTGTTLEMTYSPYLIGLILVGVTAAGLSIVWWRLRSFEAQE